MASLQVIRLLIMPKLTNSLEALNINLLHGKGRMDWLTQESFEFGQSDDEKQNKGAKKPAEGTKIKGPVIKMGQNGPS